MDPYSAALDLLRRLPPTNVSANLDVISRLCPDIAEDLAVSVDQPLQLKSDGESGKEYLCCDYNRDGESYRFVYLRMVVVEMVVVAVVFTLFTDSTRRYFQVALVERLLSTTSRWSRTFRDAERARSGYERSF
jgi:hypothetical protein